VIHTSKTAESRPVPQRCCAMCGSTHAQRAHWLYGYYEGGAAICFECAREFVIGVIHD
jgi:hypothetical protein